MNAEWQLRIKTQLLQLVLTKPVLRGKKPQRAGDQRFVAFFPQFATEIEDAVARIEQYGWFPDRVLITDQGEIVVVLKEQPVKA